jgi:hypothetical protein
MQGKQAVDTNATPALLQRGVTKLTLAVFIFLISCVVYFGGRVLTFYYYYYEIQNQMAAVIKVADTENDESVRRKLLYHVKKLELPVEPTDLKIMRDGRFMRIELKYQEVLDLDLSWAGKEYHYDLHFFNFIAQAQGTF